MSDKGDGQRKPEGSPAPAKGPARRAPWQAPRIVDYGSIRNLVRAGTGHENEGVGVGAGQKIKSHF